MISSAKDTSLDALYPPINYSRSTSDDHIRTSTSEDEPEIPILPVKMYPQLILAHKTNEKGDVSYLVKFRNRSYYELEWLSSNDIVKLLPNSTLLRNYERNKDLTIPTMAPFFNFDYLIPEKIISEQVCQGQIKYMIKWCGLDYSECTWESIGFIKQHHVNNFSDSSLKNQNNSINLDAAFNDILDRYQAQLTKPPDEELKIPDHPDSNSFSLIKQSCFPKSKKGYKIRSYQVEGVNFIMKLWYNRKNAILADEMGLGKTLQSLMFLNMLYIRQKIWGPFLVIVPLSTISNWERETNEWTELRYLSFYGSKARRTLMLQNELFYFDTNILKTQILFTTYEYAVKMSDLFSKIEWQAVVVDEAHRIKNNKSKLFTSLMKLKSAFKLLLTGTPLQNNISELWSLLHFIDKDQFQSFEEFNDKFGKLDKSQQIDDIQTMLRPLMLRRLKGEVEKSISPFEEIIIECPMTQHQKAYYSSIYQQNLDYLSRGAHTKSHVNLRNVCMELRKCCNHPYLINGAEDQILVERREAEKLKKIQKMKDQGQNIDQEKAGLIVDEAEFENECLIRSSGKMILLDKLLDKLKKGGHRILIFSQMVKMLDIIEDYLLFKEYNSQRLDGCIKGEKRQRAIDDFNDPESSDFIFLLATKAGGLGINLTTADTVIIYDSDWNPQNDIQAIARCHRIGQTKNVKVYRFLTANSYERTLFDSASHKLGLDTVILGKNHKLTSKQTTDVEKMIKLGAYYAFSEESKDNEEFQKFSEENIDSILKRSHRISHDHIASGVEGSTFSKLLFQIEPDSALDLSAPNFWQKYIPKETKETKLIKQQVLNNPNKSKSKSKSLTKLSDSEKSESESEPSENDADTFSDSSNEFVAPKKTKKKIKQQVKRSRSNISLSDEGDIEVNCEVTEWSESELESLLKLLMSFGLGRWKFLYNHSDDIRINHDEQDLRRASLSIVQYLITSDNQKLMSKEKNFLEEIFLKPQNKNLLEFIDRFNKKHGSILKQITSADQNNSLSLILLLYFLNEIIFSCQDPPNDIPIPSNTVSKPTEWWSDKDDKLLLYHIWKNGFNEFTNIRLTHSFNDKSSSSKNKKKNKENDDHSNHDDNGNELSEYVKYFLSRRVMSTLLEFKQLFTTYHDRIKNKKDIIYNSKTLTKAINMWTGKEQKDIISTICTYGINDLNKCYDASGMTKKSFKKFKKFVYKIIDTCNSVFHGIKTDPNNNSNESLPIEITKSMAEKVLIRIDLIDKLTKLNDLSKFSKIDQGIIKYLKSNGFVDLNNCPEANQKFKSDKLGYNVNKFVQELFDIRPSKNNIVPFLDLEHIKKIAEEGSSNYDPFTTNKNKNKIIRKKNKNDKLIKDNPDKKKLTRKRKTYSDDNYEVDSSDEESSTIKNKRGRRKNKITIQEDNNDDDDDSDNSVEVIETKPSENKNSGIKRKNKKDDDDNYENDDVEITKVRHDENTDDKFNALLPLTIQNNLIIVSLGTVVTDRPGFHNDKYLYPAGFISEHLFQSIANPNEKIWYRSLIIDRGGPGPAFRVESKEDPSVFFEGKNPTNPWMQLVKAVEESKLKLNIGNHSATSISGPLYFGLAIPEVKKMIKSLPNASEDGNKRSNSFVKTEKKVKTESFNTPNLSDDTTITKSTKQTKISKPEKSSKLFKDKTKGNLNLKKIHRRNFADIDEKWDDIDSDDYVKDTGNKYTRKNKEKTSSSSQPYSSPLSDEREDNDFISTKNKSKIKSKKSQQNDEMAFQSLHLQFDKIDFDFPSKNQNQSFSLNTKAVDKLLREKFQIPPNQDPIKFANRKGWIY